MATYSYDPSKIMDGGVDQMRFELGDTVVDMESVTSPLCDEEYSAIIAKYGKKWRIAKLKCLEAIMMKFSYEVNTSVDGLSYSLDQRFQRWKEMYEDARKEANAIAGVPKAGNPASVAGHTYFYNDMQANIRKF